MNSVFDELYKLTTIVMPSLERNLGSIPTDTKVGSLTKCGYEAPYHYQGAVRPEWLNMLLDSLPPYKEYKLSVESETNMEVLRNFQLLMKESKDVVRFSIYQNGINPHYSNADKLKPVNILPSCSDVFLDKDRDRGLNADDDIDLYKDIVVQCLRCDVAANNLNEDIIGQFQTTMDNLKVVRRAVKDKSLLEEKTKRPADRREPSVQSYFYDEFLTDNEALNPKFDPAIIFKEFGPSIPFMVGR